MRFGLLADLVGVRICPPTVSAITRAATCTACPNRSHVVLVDLASVDVDADIDRALRGWRCSARAEHDGLRRLH